MDTMMRQHITRIEPRSPIFEVSLRSDEDGLPMMWWFRRGDGTSCGIGSYISDVLGHRPHHFEE